GGEKSRLLLARLMADPANFLLLDEPTNHLDPPSRKMLEGVLAGYDGTLCFVSHDRCFINAVANRIVEITAGGVEQYLGNFDDYADQKKEREKLAADQGAPEKENRPKKTAAGRKAARQERARFVAERSRALNPIRKAIAELESEIQRLEARAEEIKTLLADPATYEYSEKARALPAELGQINTSLEKALAKWTELSEELSIKEKEFEEE
ncbi:MAG: multidrug ABC transporter ATP-binding protein, partial [bacterium]